VDAATGTPPVDAVRAEGLSRSFGDIVAVHPIDLAVRPGEVFGLVGPDGAGKTTTIRMLTTILAPTAGAASVLGRDVVRDRGELRARLGYMSQQFNLYGDLTVQENLRFFADLHGVTGRSYEAKVEELLAFSRLGPFLSRRAEFLSGGMKQKLALACNLIHEPEILFLDEPTTGVDPVSRRDFWRILGDLHAKGITLIISTPYMDEADRCDRVGFLDGGRLLTVATPDEIKGRLGGSVLEVVAEPRRRARELLKGVPEIHDVELFGDRLQVRTADVEAAEAAVRGALSDAGIAVEDIRTVAPTMETAFAAMAKEHRL
jgi:ABC-2 type transport system ATP-binding protein